MNMENVRLSGAFISLAALLLAASPGLAAPVCIDAGDPQCAQQTDDPQPNAGDVAPGVTDDTVGAPPAMSAPAMALPRAVRPPAPVAAPPPPPPPLPKKLLEPDGEDPQ
jgi:hypothetical protein